MTRAGILLLGNVPMSLQEIYKRCLEKVGRVSVLYLAVMGTREDEQATLLRKDVAYPLNILGKHTCYTAFPNIFDVAFFH